MRRMAKLYQLKSWLLCLLCYSQCCNQYAADFATSIYFSADRFCLATTAVYFLTFSHCQRLTIIK